jgi:hypothetical protein
MRKRASSSLPRQTLVGGALATDIWRVLARARVAMMADDRGETTPHLLRAEWTNRRASPIPLFEDVHV